MRIAAREGVRTRRQARHAERADGVRDWLRTGGGQRADSAQQCASLRLGSPAEVKTGDAEHGVLRSTDIGDEFGEDPFGQGLLRDLEPRRDRTPVRHLQRRL